MCRRRGVGGGGGGRGEGGGGGRALLLVVSRLSMCGPTLRTIGIVILLKFGWFDLCSLFRITREGKDRVRPCGIRFMPTFASAGLAGSGAQ